MIYFDFTKPGGKWNEDRVFSCEDFSFVLDGATCLTGDHFSSFGSDAEWYSNWWYEYLKVELKDLSKTIPEILKTGVKNIVKDYQKLSNGQAPEDFPSATVSIVRRVNGELEVYSLCDSSIVILTKTGESILIQDPNNEVNDCFNLVTIKGFAVKEKTTLLEARKNHADIVLKGRMKKNKFGGYHVLADSVEAIDYGIYNSISEELIDKVLIMSDGYSQVFDVVKFMSYDDLIKKINSLSDVEKIYNKLYKYQESDKEGNKYLRFKVRDDASVAFMKF